MDDERHCSGAATRLLVRLVRSRGGDPAVEQLLEAAGDSRPVEELEDVRTWSTFWEFRALLEATSTALGDPDAPRAAGAETVVQPGSAAESIALLRAMGTPAGVLRWIPELATRMCTVVDVETIDAGDGVGLVRAVSRPGFARFTALCQFTAGLLAKVPTVFDLPDAEVVEVQCETRGDSQCLFRLSWGPGRPVPVAAAVDRAYAVIAARFEALRDSVADLVSGEDVETVLTRIADRAGLAVRAPRHLLAVRGPGDTAVRVHHRGFSDPEAADQAAALLADGTHGGDGSWRVADVVSSHHSYGRLAAVHQQGVTFFPEEQAVLVAYARLAAAALDVATAVADARRQATVARALLRLAAELASTVSVTEVAERVARTLPNLVDADAAGVWLWQPEDECLSLAAQVGFSADAERAVSRMAVAVRDSKAVRQMLDDPRPRFASADASEDQLVAGLLELTGHSAAWVVPITVDGEFLGALAAGVVDGPERLKDRADVVDALSGVAPFAAIAIRNAQLVDQMRERANHDPLTGLPNPRLLADRLDRAVVQASRAGQRFGVLYLDLDRFKTINDTFGHVAGDEILRGVAERLLATVRAEDTVARVGGDEFVLVLPRVGAPDEVGVVAEKVRMAVAEPVELAGGRFDVSASIGVAIFPTDAATVEGLLRSADRAMYDAKRMGRDRVAWASPLTNE